MQDRVLLVAAYWRTNLTCGCLLRGSAQVPRQGSNSFAWSGYRDLVVRAHIQLNAPIVLVWDNLNTHLAAGMREYADTHGRLTTVQLPSYAPDLNPAEGIWSLLRRGPLANVAFTDDDHLERTLRRGLRHIQHRPHSSTAALPEPDSPSPTSRQQTEEIGRAS